MANGLYLKLRSISGVVCENNCDESTEGLVEALRLIQARPSPCQLDLKPLVESECYWRAC